MARRTFFSFDYKYAWKVNQIRSMKNVISTSAVGFEDASLWEEARKKGDQEVHRMIDEALTRYSGHCSVRYTWNNRQKIS